MIALLLLTIVAILAATGHVVAAIVTAAVALGLTLLLVGAGLLLARLACDKF